MDAIPTERLTADDAGLTRAAEVLRAGGRVALPTETVYGLGAVIQSTDAVKAQEIADRLDTGMVYINEAPGTAAELPFGGIKRSGVGRELGKYGMDEFVNRKLIRTGR